MSTHRRSGARTSVGSGKGKVEEILLETRESTGSSDEDIITEESPPRYEDIKLQKPGATVYSAEDPPKVIVDENGEEHFTAPAETPRDLITEVIHATDDPTLNPWTFRTWFLGKRHTITIPLALLTSYRYLPCGVLGNACYHLLLQTSDCHCVNYFPGCH